MKRRDHLAAFVSEVLEDRILLLTTPGTAFAQELLEYNSQVAGRASDGIWWTSEIDLLADHGPDVTTTFAAWSPLVDWQHVRQGDFDGDGLSDLIGWDPAGGGWWVSLSDGVGSTTMLGVTWSTSTTWSDVLVARVNDDAFDDLIGRASDGQWWAALSNGDGTFRNVPLVTWEADAGWRDVFVRDLNRDGKSDLIGRSADGTWQASFAFGSTSDTVELAEWEEAAGWQDAHFVSSPLQPSHKASKDFIVARDQTGQWQALVFASDGTATSTALGEWNEAANWRDVVVADTDRDGVQELVGRTDYGEWWSSAWNGTTFTSRALGRWNEAAGWNDVYVASVDEYILASVDPFPGPMLQQLTGTFLIGRTDTGAWWASQFDTSAGHLQHEHVGRWNPRAGWADVVDGRFSRSPIVINVVYDRDPFEAFYYEAGRQVTIYAHRSGTTANVTMVPAGPGRVNYRVSYLVPSTGFEATATISNPVSYYQTPPFVFLGREGDDIFWNATDQSSEAQGGPGNDRFDGRNGVYDKFFGGPGVDVLLGDPGDLLVQD